MRDAGPTRGLDDFGTKYVRVYTNGRRTQVGLVTVLLGVDRLSGCPAHWIEETGIKKKPREGESEMGTEKD